MLDEPTNHLDLESREALEAALDAFPGTVLLVSHDRALLDAIAERTLAIEHGTLKSYNGGWAEYIRRREELDSPEASPEPEPEPEPEPKQAKPRPARTKPERATELDRIEAQIAEGEQRVADLELQLADDWSDMAKLSAHRQARDELQALLERWEQLFERSQA
jgi:ATP-binding cassette subfamily F protein 3